jgi:hypothetical protein
MRAKTVGMSIRRCSTSVPFACSMMTRLPSVNCGCSSRCSALAVATSCRIVIVARSAIAWARAMSLTASGPGADRNRFSAPMMLPRSRSGIAYTDPYPAPRAKGVNRGHRSIAARSPLEGRCGTPGYRRQTLRGTDPRHSGAGRVRSGEPVRSTQQSGEVPPSESSSKMAMAAVSRVSTQRAVSDVGVRDEGVRRREERSREPGFVRSLGRRRVGHRRSPGGAVGNRTALG